MGKRGIAILVALGMIFALSTRVNAQSSYSFSLDKEIVEATWNTDGTTTVDYTFNFTNDPNGHVIDFVDVGMPNGSFGTSGIRADAGGNQLEISSDYQGQGSYGFSVVMGPYAIQPGSSGIVHVHIPGISNLLFPDSNDPSTYASADFSPTWFGSQYVHGSTDLTMIFHLPTGVQASEPRYHTPQGNWPGAEQPITGFDDQNRVTYTWESPNANGFTQYTFGASFPQTYVPAGSISTPPSFDLFGTILGAIGFITSNMFTFCCWGFFILMFVGSPILGAINQSRRKLEYLPPKIQIEGHGIKRGLTAVEAAILMEQPLDKVMMMILFGVIKKNAASVTSKEPLKLQASDPLPADLYDYEKDFLKAFSGDQMFQRRDLEEMTVKLVNSVSEKMKGFSRKETIDYYKSIMENAWQQVETAGTPEVKSQLFDQNMEWTMLDHNYGERTQRVFTGPIFVPMWWGHYDPTFRGASSTPVSTGMGAPSAPSSGRSSIPGATMAASMVTGAQTFASQVIGNVSSFTSGVTNRTNPVPVSTSSGHYSGGGGHCACACACAGCACACAGGGR